MTKRVLATIALGDDYMRMGVALMRSAHAHQPKIDRYVIYTDDKTDVSLFEMPSYVEVRPCSRNRDLFPDNPFAPRMDKTAPIVDPDTMDAVVVFLDSDTIICRNVLDQLFEEVEERSIVVHATDRPDDHDWMTRPKPGGSEGETEGFNLKQAAATIGCDVPNFTLNAGVFGRAPDAAGIRFSERADALLKDPPFMIWPGTNYLNDEPFLAISYLEARAEFGLEHKPLPRDIYMGLANLSLDVVMEESGAVRVDGDKPAIVHFAGKGRRDTEVYRAYLRRYAPVRPEAVSRIGALIESNPMFADLREA